MAKASGLKFTARSPPGMLCIFFILPVENVSFLGKTAWKSGENLEFICLIKGIFIWFVEYGNGMLSNL